MTAINRLNAGLGALALMGAGLFFFPNFGGSGLTLPYNNWLWALAGLGAGLVVAGQLWRGQLQLPTISLMAGGAALLLALVAGVQWLAGINIAPTQAIMALLGLALLPLVFGQWPRLRLLQLLQAMALLAVGHGVVVALWLWLGPGSIDLSNPRIYGVLQQTNLFGSMALLGLASSLALAHEPKRSTLAKALNWLALAMCVFAIYYSNSRTAFVGTAFVALCAAFSPAVRNASKGSKWLGIGLIVVAGLCAQLMLNDSVQGGARRGAEQLLDAGGSHRIDIWQISLQLFADAPLLGHGIGNFQGAFAPKQAATYAESGLYGVAHLHHPHNELLLWLSEGGLLLTLPMLLLLSWLVRRWWRAKRFDASEWALLCAVGLHSLLEYPLHASALHLSAFALVLLLLEQRRYPLLRFHLPRAQLGAVLSVLLGCGAALFFASNILTLQGLWAIANSPMDQLQRQKAINALPNQWALSRQIEYAFYANRLELAMNNFDPTLALSFVEWAAPRVTAIPDAKLMTNLVKAYTMIGAKEAAEQTRQDILYLFPPEVAKDVWPSQASAQP